MLKKENRLQKEKDFGRVFKNSRPISTEHLSIRARMIGGDKPVRFGFVISNKVNKLATRRNALKRQLREIARGLISELRTGYDVVVVVRSDFSFPYDQAQIRSELEAGLGKAGMVNKISN